MKKLNIYLSVIALLLGSALLAYAEMGKSEQQAVLLDINGGIGPASADYIVRGILKAKQSNAALIVIRMDTPGGLDKSMRSINKAILSSPIPVVTFVSPSGARAASAGTYILYASHIAAMAPGTNLGAATPVSIGGGSETPDKQKNNPDQASAMKAKATNDAIAYIRSLAQLRGRNAEWAGKAVSDAATLTANDALKAGVIDVVASDIKDLFAKINGKNISIGQSYVILNTTNMTVDQVEPDWRTKFLAVITDPSVAYILLLLGAYGIFFEFVNPGFVLPGVVGAIALLLALYALQLLPVNYAGLGLIILGVAFMVGEAFMPSFGALGIGGVVAFVVGSVLLFDTSVAGFQIAWPVIIAMAVINIIVFVFVIGMAVSARRRRIVSGREDLIDQTGTALADFDHSGQARINGEIWTVHANTRINKGDTVVVYAIKGLILEVKKQ